MDTVLVPMKADAFSLTTDCVSPRNHYCIAPITQPNHTFLRLDNALLSADILDHVDLHGAIGDDKNTRIRDLGTGQLRQRRLGVYLHWTLPYFYRVATAVAEGGLVDQAKRSQAAQQQNQRKQAAGFPARSCPDPGPESDLSIPDYRPIPNRWLITRRLDRASVQPADASALIPEVQSWVIQSDAVNNVNDLPAEIDLETDVSPGIDPADLKPTGARVINGPAEIFLGKRTPLESWDPVKADRDAHVNLTVMTTSNPLFADYQPHNSNVLSFIDNFEYTRADGKTGYLDNATADYSVIGWHSDDGDDPFTTVSGVDPGDHKQRLSQCRMMLKDDTYGSAATWASTKGDARLLCHATMYGVKYTAGKQPSNVAAEAAGKTYHDHQPISVGVSPMDALLAYCAAYNPGGNANMDLLVQDLKKLEGFLRQSEDDDIDGLQAAEDERYEQAFARIEAGSKWHYGDQTSPEAAPVTANADVISNLSALNRIQEQLDSATREVSQIRWKLFAEWWIALSDFYQDKGKWNQRVSDYYSRLSNLLRVDSGQSPARDGRIHSLSQQLIDKTNALRLSGDRTDTTHWTLDNMPPMPTILNKTASDRFYMRKDPTIFFGSMPSAFEADFTDLLPVRLLDQVITALGAANDSSWKTLLSSIPLIASKLPTSLQSSVSSLLKEFGALWHHDGTPPTQQTLPWYHQEISSPGKPERASRDTWQDTQPWAPLFVEWEATYYHIPFEKWQMELQPGHYKGQTVHYAVSEDVSKMKLETRQLSGRNILAPQAQSTLKTKLEEVFQNTPKSALDGAGLDGDEQTRLLAAVRQLATVSAPLTGLTSHLLTLNEGSHFKPLVRQPNQRGTAIDSAITADPTNPRSALKDLVDLHVNPDPTAIFKSIEGSASSTPYGASVAGALYQLPVTHGQFIFTKVNIIDKFGQVVPCINPLPQQKGQPFVPIYPAISDSLWVGMIDKKGFAAEGAKLNCAVSQADKNACPFIALPPAINQAARLNAAFVQKVKDGDRYVWRRCTEWDNPVFGWLVINYADLGIQIFRKDGRFYREVRLGGRHGTLGSAKWLPFEATEPSTDSDLEQLDHFIQRLMTPDDDSYVKGIIEMIQIALGDGVAGNTSVPHAPASYAEFSSAIVGKPLALCYAGYSLELAAEPAQNWSTSAPTIPRSPARTLMKAPSDPRDQIHYSQWSSGDPSAYTFPVKLGDVDRLFDGLIGFFPTHGGPLSATSSDLDYDTLYTNFMRSDWKKAGKDPRQPVVNQTFTPYWGTSGAPGEPLFDHDAKLQVLGMLVDPFLPVHAYSAILPNKALQLPPWIVEQSLKNITAFWHVGPIVLPRNAVPAFDSTHVLDSNTVIDTKPRPSLPLPLAPPVASKSGGDAAYRFLQPHWVVDDDTKAASTKFNALEIAGGAGTGSGAPAPHAPGPYTALEGYLQIAKSLASAKLADS